MASRDGIMTHDDQSKWWWLHITPSTPWGNINNMSTKNLKVFSKTGISRVYPSGTVPGYQRRAPLRGPPFRNVQDPDFWLVLREKMAEWCMTRPWIKRLLEYNTEEFKTLLSPGTWTIQTLWYPTWFTQVTGIIWLGWTIYNFDAPVRSSRISKRSATMILQVPSVSVAMIPCPGGLWQHFHSKFHKPYTFCVLLLHMLKLSWLLAFPGKIWWNPNVLHLKSIFSVEITIFRKKNDGFFIPSPSQHTIPAHRGTCQHTTLR